MKTPVILETAVAVGAALTESRLLRPVGPGPAVRIARAIVGNSANMPLLLAVSAARWPDRTALVDDLGELTYTELATYADAIAGGLHHELATTTGDSVAIMCRNSRYAVAGVFGVMSTGADALLLNTDFHPEVLQKSLARQEIRAILCDEEFASTVRAAGYTGPLVYCFDEATTAPGLAARGETTAAPASSTHTVSEWVRRDYAPLGRMPVGRLVLLTSGTTGTPKGVPRRPELSMVGGTAAAIIRRTRLRTGAVIAAGIPMFHGFGLGIVLLGIALGGKLVLRRRFDAEAASAAVAAHRVEMFAGVPVMLQRLLAVPGEVRRGHDLSSLRVVLSGAAPLSPALAQRFTAEFGELLYNGYGSSEVGIGTLATPADLRSAPGTVGRPVTGVEIRVLDDTGSELPPGRVGRIFVGGGLGFTGYSGGGDKTRVGGLISSGDLGRLDIRGRLFLVGREDDMIVSGGENVYPQSVENVLAAHPSLADAAVIGVPDDEFGQRLAAFAVPARNQQPTAEGLREYLRDKVSRHERPRDITLVPEIPRNPTGKIDRKALRTLTHPSGAA
ncbi:acyl-CoA synthetase (AMP-forming)/AMP-acid ligase II [Nocardia transvalensis]|uniref:Acyl-CoA synthetase (AMP-forming)/AMP-acid ligase II n=1 Tax=Nocardia transvalensis TaxID=37333 RepID=A0A7W9PFB9_9NOCA|nr:AMP-binding protein [Nocardia transvalensis]MBB5915144.1 acyl-CoA synthetase (AMP-forming)/AMP-acid ligase II [Nocardia transvalensis]